MINLSTGMAQVSPEIEDWLILQPNSAKKLLLALIDQTIQNHSMVSESEQRLLKELADTSSKMMQQRLWVYNEQTASFSSLTSYYQAGLSVTGDPTTGNVPKDMLNLLNLIRHPIQNLVLMRDSCDYEDRLNTYEVAARNNTDYLTMDTMTLQAWKDLISEYTEDLDAPVPSTSTLANNLKSLSTTPIFLRNALPADKKNARQIALETAQAQQYPAGRLLAQLYAESTYNPTAMSGRGAAGLAQFMPGTGPSYGLVSYPEDFFDPKKSSLACIRYMRYLQRLASTWGAANEQEAWKIALAAYNNGQGNIKTAFTNAGLPTNKSQPLTWDHIAKITPEETQQYVTKIVAMQDSPV